MISVIKEMMIKIMIMIKRAMEMMMKRMRM